MSEIRLISVSEAALALPALRELPPSAPALADANAFEAYLNSSTSEGYHLAGAFVPGRKEAACVAGYRMLTNPVWGKFLCLDDLSTLPEERGQGHAAAVLTWLEAEARRLGCAEIHLDSGTLPARYAAHRQYLKAGYNITCHHFGKRLV